MNHSGSPQEQHVSVSGTFLKLLQGQTAGGFCGGVVRTFFSYLTAGADKTHSW